MSADHLAREAAADAAELRRITRPVPIDVIHVGCDGACEQGIYDCDCDARPVSTWRDVWEAEIAHPWLAALYALVLAVSIAAAWLWPQPWWGPW